MKEIAEKEPYPNLRLLRLTGDGAYEVSKRLGFRLKSKPKFLRLLQYRKTQQRLLRGEIQQSTSPLLSSFTCRRSRATFFISTFAVTKGSRISASCCGKGMTKY